MELWILYIFLSIYVQVVDVELAYTNHVKCSFGISSLYEIIFLFNWNYIFLSFSCYAPNRDVFGQLHDFQKN